MIVKYVLNTFPYWIYGENKIASYDKLDEWLEQNGIDYDNSFKINEINKDRLSIITKNPNIKYVEVFTDLKTYYYYQTNIEFIANKTYQVSFELDWYATYGLDLIRDLNGKNVFVKRSHHALQDPFKSCVIEDEKLNEIIPVNTDINFIEDEIFSYNVDGKLFYGVEGKNITGVPGRYYCYDFSKYKFANIYAIWKSSAVDNGLGYWIMPISTQEKNITADMFVYNIQASSKQAFNNSIQNVRQINKNTNWANGFVGIFTGPSLITKDALVNQVNGLPTKSLFYKLFIISYFQEYNNPQTLLNYSGNEPLRLNFKNGLYSPNILNYYDFKMGNSNLDALNFEISNNKFKIKDGYISFNENSFVFYNELKYEGFKDIVKTFPGALMSESKPYLEYVEQNRNRINTSLAIGASTMVGSIATKNPIAIGAGVMSGVKSIVGIKSNLKDKKRELLDKPNASYDNDNAYYILFDLLKNIKSTPLIHYRNLENLAKYNNEIVYYGWKQNKYLPFNTTGLNKHFYIQIDANELFNQYPQLFTSIPQNYLEEIINLLNNGLRLWNDVVVQYE